MASTNDNYVEDMFVGTENAFRPIALNSPTIIPLLSTDYILVLVDLVDKEIERLVESTAKHKGVEFKEVKFQLIDMHAIREFLVNAHESARQYEDSAPPDTE